MAGGGFNRFVGPVDILLVGSGQPGDSHRLTALAAFDQGANLLGNTAHSFKIAGRSNRKTSFTHIDTESGQLAGDF